MTPLKLLVLPVLCAYRLISPGLEYFLLLLSLTKPHYLLWPGSHSVELPLIFCIFSLLSFSVFFKGSGPFVMLLYSSVIL